MLYIVVVDMSQNKSTVMNTFYLFFILQVDFTKAPSDDEYKQNFLYYFIRVKAKKLN